MNKLARFAAKRLKSTNPEDEIFFELASGSQFSGKIKEMNSDDGFIIITLGDRRSIIIRMDEIAAIGINAVWHSPNH